MISGIFGFLLGILLTYLILRKKIKIVKEEINKVRVLSAEKLNSAYEQIDKLKEDNKNLINILKSKNNAT